MPCTRSQLVPLCPILHQWPKDTWLDTASRREVVHPALLISCLPHGLLHVSSILHAQPIPLALTPGEGWTWHSHAALWAPPGCRGAPCAHHGPSGVPIPARNAAHHHPSLSQASAAPGTYRRVLIPSRPLELGLCSTHEPLTRDSAVLSGGLSHCQGLYPATKPHPGAPGTTAAGRDRSRSAPP